MESQVRGTVIQSDHDRRSNWIKFQSGKKTQDFQNQRRKLYKILNRKENHAIAGPTLIFRPKLP